MRLFLIPWPRYSLYVNGTNYNGAITRTPGNPITGRGGPLNEIGTAIQVFNSISCENSNNNSEGEEKSI